MGKILKPGRVVILLNGRFAGRKGVVMKSYDEGTSERPYGHALIVGIDKYPLKVTKRMGKKTVAKRSKTRPFIKVVSLQHCLPTRCIFDVEFDKSLVNKESVKEPEKKKKAKLAVKKQFETIYKTEKSKWLFSKLRF
ncbi:ribosomal l27e protein family domain-containing protein [Ditylenchus destructor]|nr:ribosomal l27e protein family domain-containing protein [Ditylenchus destructor]